ncbi:PREDICTED: ATP-dependent DNA helicase PIF1-like [Ipomoea nil]|uniref:ATP-dependent DNA helicase PIF1-like n=1 Tax=Ipomoea nil TaxID=35883 RepID=UPI000901FA9B|nr:PREDICTED: ATP-dependent DNA helicase PIF1-like [Ipomoea nil]
MSENKRPPLQDISNDLILSEDEKNNFALHEIQIMFSAMGKSLKDFPLMPNDKLVHQLTEEQRAIYGEVLQDAENNLGGLFFVYGYGGTGKTFLWRALSSALRSKGDIVLNVASSGIASLLLPGGRTAHLRFSIPIAVNEDSTCNISQSSPLAQLIMQSKLIIWDEAPMMHKFCFEALDRTMRDIMRAKNPKCLDMTFGGKTVVLGGDFRQILPVIPKGTRQDIVGASINASYLWRSCKVFRLTKNLRLRSLQSDTEVKEIEKFAKWIANIGDGTIGDCLHGEYRAILAPTLDIVDAVNEYMNDYNNAEGRTYLSCDSVCKSDSNVDMLADLHTAKFLNGLRCSGVPNHSLTLKVGSPVMLLRNIDHSLGLCNGTRMIISKLADHVLEAQILCGASAGTKVLIPMMSLTPSDARLPFKFQRKQFPLMLSYAMIINKCQGQTLSNVGLFLKRLVFNHGQMYVAVSRVSNPKGLKILIWDETVKSKNTTTKVVYKEVFNNV